MTLRVRTALKNGLRRAFTRNGLLLVGVYLVVNLLQGGLVYAVTTTVVPLGPPTIPGETGGVSPTPGSQLPALVSLQAALLVSFTGGLLTIPIQVIAHRTFVSEWTDQIPDEFIFHRLGWTTLNSFVGSWLVSLSFLIVAGLCVGVGFWGLFSVAVPSTTAFLLGDWLGRLLLAVFGLVLLVPSVLLGVSLIFVGQEIAVRDKNVISALASSWRLTRGHRLRLLMLAVLPMILQLVVSYGLFAVLPPLPAQFIALIETGVVNLVVLAIMARAYVQTEDDDGGPSQQTGVLSDVLLGPS
ncbi:hypothetical protein [Halostagnicola kamekurae]|uniref:DUF7847 domain-containing protein n=1 Tax=Halostagnicola kamekurae TaxID=619731 RepID=A0A1I6QQA5_9EURY|nr:hypothetical protein [Halostagnicola kamekurae]SFS54646.1 hypothetical protein SAMN04488556_1448 [Halostagnicola kamekurae]